MSGGSFNYLYGKDLAMLLESGMSDLKHMAEELDGLGYDAAPLRDRTNELIERIREVEADINEEIQRLAPVWRAVEWWCSCDSSREQVFVAIGEYNAARRAEAGR